MDDALPILAVFGFIPLIVWIVYYFRTKAHARTADLIGKMVDRGDAITPETVKALGIRGANANADLKTGLILIALAAAFVIFGLSIPDEEATEIMRAIASFPFLVGLALIGYWFFMGRKSAQD